MNGTKEVLRSCARTNAEVDVKWNEETVKITVTSDKAQTIEISVYGGAKESVTFNEGETKVIEFKR